MSENLTTRTCKRGHTGLYYRQKSGRLKCRACGLEDSRAVTAKRKAKGLTANGTPPVFAPPHIRFWEHVEKTGSCWLFKPAVEAERKYGNFFVSPQRKNVLAHRYSYEISIGPIPEGMTLDHLCEVTQCVNPEHLEPVTLGENLRRAHLAGDVCKNDHVYEEVGYFFTQEGWIVCKQCRKDSRARKAVSA